MNRPFIIGATPKQVRREDNITGTPMEMPGGPLTSRINSVVNLQPILRSFPVMLPGFWGGFFWGGLVANINLKKQNRTIVQSWV